MRKPICALLLTSLALVGCSGEPPAPSKYEILEKAGPHPDNYQLIIKTYFATRLVDPASAMYGPMTAPYPGFLRPYLAGGGLSAAPVVGYVVCGTVNSKNRMGGYAGSKPFAAVIKNGVVAYAELPTIQC